MGQVSGRLADFTVITAEDPRTEELADINQEIAAGVQEVIAGSAAEKSMQTSKEVENIKRPSRTQAEFLAPRFAIVPDRTEAIRFGVEMARAGDVVASFGKGHERSMCYGETEYPWNEQDAMLSALRARTGGLEAK